LNAQAFYERLICERHPLQFPVRMPFMSHAVTLQETEPPFAEMDTPALSIVG
jgi:hypothetical protein